MFDATEGVRGGFGGVLAQERLQVHAGAERGFIAGDDHAADLGVRVGGIHRVADCPVGVGLQCVALRRVGNADDFGGAPRFAGDVAFQLARHGRSPYLDTKPARRPLMISTVSATMRSMSSWQDGMSLMMPWTGPADQMPASISPVS